jgi:hypothetical protein
MTNVDYLKFIFLYSRFLCHFRKLSHWVSWSNQQDEYRGHPSSNRGHPRKYWSSLMYIRAQKYRRYFFSATFAKIPVWLRWHNTSASYEKCATAIMMLINRSYLYLFKQKWVTCQPYKVTYPVWKNIYLPINYYIIWLSCDQTSWHQFPVIIYMQVCNPKLVYQIGLY